MSVTRNTAYAPTERRDESLRAGSAAEISLLNSFSVEDFRIPHILIIEADDPMREQLELCYLQQGYLTVALPSAEDGLRRLDAEDVDLVVTDIVLPGTDGVQLISHIHQSYPDLPVIAITADADIQTAVDVLKLGACDFVMKPFDVAAVLESTRAALEKTKGERGIRQLRRWLKEHFQFGELLSQTPQMRRVFEVIQLAAPTDLPVLIQGEAGTGRALLASALHHHSARRAGPFVTIQCAGVPDALLERELFGYDKNLFAGADEGKAGKIAAAHGGTLFLDEITSLSLAIQEKILRVIENREVYRLGAAQSVGVDLRVIAATGFPVAEGTMHSELYQRVSSVSVQLLPLRERAVDIPSLVQSFLRHHPIAKSKRIAGISDKVLRRLMEYSWPGNIRELQNVLEYAILMAPGRIIEEVKLAQPAGAPAREKTDIAGLSLRQWLKEREKYFLTRKLEDLGGSIALTAKSCRIGVRTLSRKMRRYGLNKKIFKSNPVTTKPATPKAAHLSRDHK
jgi:DNA-binding NtrC family response regulator